MNLIELLSCASIVNESNYLILANRANMPNTGTGQSSTRFIHDTGTGQRLMRQTAGYTKQTIALLNNGHLCYKLVKAWPSRATCQILAYALL